MFDRFEKFTATIFEISRSWHKLASGVMEKYGLNGPYAVYFTNMYRFPEGITSIKLAELCSRDKSDVSRAINLLEKKGLVVKRAVNENFYRAALILTEEGRKIAEVINEKVKLAVQLGGNGLTDNQREVFYHALELISSNLEALSEKGI